MSKFYRPLAAIALVAALGLPLAGCGQTGPEETVDTALSAIKAMDGSTLATVYSGGKLDSKSKDVVGMLSAKDDLAMTASTANLSQSQQDFIAAVQKKLCSFDYTIDSVATDGNTAKVTVTFKAYDFGSAYEDGMQGFGSGFITAVSNGTDESGEMTKVLISKVKDEVNSLESKSKKKSITLDLTKEKGTWMLKELSKDQLDAMFGNIVQPFRS